MESIIKFIVGALLIIVIIAIGSLIFGFPVMLIWNWIMPDLVKVNGISVFQEITYWQAFGLNLLCGFLIKGLVNLKNE